MGKKLKYEREKNKHFFSYSFLDRYFDSLIQKKIVFQIWFYILSDVMIHIEILFTSTSISNHNSLILKKFHFQKLLTMGVPWDPR